MKYTNSYMLIFLTIALFKGSLCAMEPKDGNDSSGMLTTLDTVHTARIELLSLLNQAKKNLHDESYVDPELIRKIIVLVGQNSEESSEWAVRLKDIIQQLEEERKSRLLYEAIQNSNIEGVGEALRTGADPNRRYNGMLPLDQALSDWFLRSQPSYKGQQQTSSAKIIRSLLNHSAIDTSLIHRGMQDDFHNFQIESTIYENDIGRMKTILDSDYDPNIPLKVEESLLKYAINIDKPKIVKLLVSYPKVNVNGENYPGQRPPLARALLLERVECVDALLSCPRVRITGDVLDSARDIVSLKKLLADRRTNPNEGIIVPLEKSFIVFSPLELWIKNTKDWQFVKALVAHKDTDLYKVCNRVSFPHDSPKSIDLSPLELAWTWREYYENVSSDDGWESVKISKINRYSNIINIIGTRVSTQQKYAIVKSVNKWENCPEDIAGLIASFATGVQPLSKPKPASRWNPQLFLCDPTENENKWIMSDIDSFKEWEELAG